MKFAAITGRGSKKDFVDLYFLFQYFSLDEMFGFYSQKYPDGSKILVLKSLAYFGDADEDVLPFMFNQIEWDTVKETITNQLLKYNKSLWRADPDNI